jgi:Ca2+-transporting ATPase
LQGFFLSDVPSPEAAKGSDIEHFPNAGSTAMPDNMRFVIAVKGAPDVVMSKSRHFMGADGSIIELSENLKQNITGAIETMSEDALRVLAVGYRLCPYYTPEMPMTSEEVERDFVFVGLFGIMDPARSEVADAIQTAKTAGIRTVMITGDYPKTAMAVGRSIGLLAPGNRVISGAELEQMDDVELVKALDNTDAFARVSPHHKVRVVDALRTKGFVVAMTGDGVNDAPALKKADIGVAMGITGTDVAKETADMVLTDDNYVSIVSAVEQGRIIYSNIRKFVFFLLSSNVAEIMIVFLATLGGLPVPLAAVQLLWLNLITDGAPALALAMEKGDPDIMEQPPRPKTEMIINRTMKYGIFIQTLAQSSAVLGAFAIGLYWTIQSSISADTNPLLAVLQYNWKNVDVAVAQTMGYATLSLCELLRAFTVRSERSSIFTIGFTSNPHLVLAVFISVALLLLTILVPFLQPIFNTTYLTLMQWQVVLGLAMVPAVVEELTKLYLRKCDCAHR